MWNNLPVELGQRDMLERVQTTTEHVFVSLRLGTLRLLLKCTVYKQTYLLARCYN